MAAALQQRSRGPPTHPAARRALAGFGTARTLVLGISRVLFATLPAATVSAAPLAVLEHNDGDDPDTGGASLWVLYLASVVLVLLGGAFAGLTIALMGQDSIYLQVLSTDDTDPQQNNARRVYNLLQKGKHWVLVTLLLSNVIVNETLPVVLDRCLGGGVAAVVGSTLLIVVFGEVLPQSVCVRYGLQIGGFMSKPVLALMWLLAPIAWPTAKVLDHALGEDHGTVYKKSGLKTLVTLHRSLGEVSERLNQDEVTIISAVLDLKEKPVSSVMTPMDDVFTMSEDTVLDEKMMDMILSAGYSRIPIHEPQNPTNFVGMLLVKILITYDPDDKMRVSEFPLATLPETRPETSCLDIVNFFQEGKSHMVLVSQYPGEDHGALGVVTLEDVIEELIGEEIIDESDVYIDVHKAIRRLQPAPRARPMRHRSTTSEFGAAASSSATKVAYDDGEPAASTQAQAMFRALSRTDDRALSTSPKMTTIMMRRSSTGADGRKTQSTVPVRANIDEMWQHLRHLGPSNRANNPKNTRSTTVKIKQGHVYVGPVVVPDRVPIEENVNSPIIEDETGDESEAGETTALLAKMPGGGAGGQQSRSPSPRQNYGATHDTAEANVTAGSIDDAAPARPTGTSLSQVATRSSESISSQVSSRQRQITGSLGRVSSSPSINAEQSRIGLRHESAARSSSESSPNRATALLSMADLQSPTSRRSLVRSGSITENVIETRGIRKVILETTSSTEEEEELQNAILGSPVHHHQYRSPLSGLHSPAARSAHVSDVEDKGIKKKELETALLAAQSSVPAAGGGQEGDAADEEEGGTVEGAENGAGASGSGGAKKKNRRRKRKTPK